MIAMALSCSPKLLIADEPTTALDVTIQRQILDLLRQLRDQRNMAMLFITHDLGVIAEIADDVAVMYRGHLVEYGAVDQIFAQPKHPYTKGLMACRPQLETRYRILPTVADFMESRKKEDGTYEIVEKTLDPVRLKEMTTQGRGRLLHPQSEVKSILGAKSEPLLKVASVGDDVRSRRDEADPYRRRPAGLLPDSQGDLPNDGRVRQSGGWNPLPGLPGADARARRRVGGAARRPPAGRSSGWRRSPGAASCSMTRTLRS